MSSSTITPIHSRGGQPVTHCGPAAETAPQQVLRLIHVLLEAMAGRRALHQVRPLLSQECLVRLAEYVDTGDFRRLAIGSVRTQMPTRHAVEATVTLLCAGRVVSCVMRLDVHGQRWVCTELAVLRPAGLVAA